MLRVTNSIAPEMRFGGRRSPKFTAEFPDTAPKRLSARVTVTRRRPAPIIPHRDRLMRWPLVLLLIAAAAAEGAHLELAEDLYAFPKYRIGFLNGMPVLNETAERWLTEGLRGGENEFLDHPWDVDVEKQSTHAFQQIDSGEQPTTLVRVGPSLFVPQPV